MLGLKDRATWITIAMISQMVGAFLAGMLGYFLFKNQTIDVPYLYAVLDTEMVA